MIYPFHRIIVAENMRKQSEIGATNQYLSLYSHYPLNLVLPVHGALVTAFIQFVFCFKTKHTCFHTGLQNQEDSKHLCNLWKLIGMESWSETKHHISPPCPLRFPSLYLFYIFALGLCSGLTAVSTLRKHSWQGSGILCGIRDCTGI